VPARASSAVAALCDRFLEWVQRKRSAATYEWYRYRLQRFVERYPDLVGALPRSGSGSELYG